MVKGGRGEESRVIAEYLEEFQVKIPNTFILSGTVTHLSL